MTTSTSIRISQNLYEQARQAATEEDRSIAAQVVYWAQVGRNALDNPDLPAHFIAQSLESLAESRSTSTDFAPRSRQG